MSPQPSEPTLKERLEASVEAARAIEALKIAMPALEFYAKEENWSADDWGIEAVIAPPDYSHQRRGGQKARNAIKRMAKVLDEGYVPKALRDG